MSRGCCPLRLICYHDYYLGALVVAGLDIIDVIMASSKRCGAHTADIATRLSPVCAMAASRAVNW